jgi:hypothetical protein
MATFTQTGGARLNNFNASYPFATLSGDSEALHLSCLGREYHFPRSTIRRLRRHRGLFSVGLRIEHTQDSLPEFIVFLGITVLLDFCFSEVESTVGESWI